MRNVFIFVLLLSFFGCRSQDNHVTFPGTNYQFILPDSSFHLNYDSTAFFSEKYWGKIDFLTDMRDTILADYTLFTKVLLLELSRPGHTILLDKEISGKNIRLLKVKIDFDITDLSPIKTGASNILWHLLFNDNGKAVVLMADYRLQYDKELNDVFLHSLSSFSKK